METLVTKSPVNTIISGDNILTFSTSFFKYKNQVFKADLIKKKLKFLSLFKA